MLDYSQFAVRIDEDDIERMDEMLRDIGEDDVHVKRLQKGVERVWRFFTYDVPDQPLGGPPEESLTLRDSPKDAFEMIMVSLRYKLDLKEKLNYKGA